MRIVYFIDQLRLDGAQYMLKQSVEGMAARGHRVCLLCGSETLRVQTIWKS